MLADPVRRALYDQLTVSTGLTREQLAERVGISASLATHHLGKLCAADLLEKRTGQPDGREGRPPAIYRRSAPLQLPDRRPELLTDLLTAGRPDMRRVRAAARKHGATSTPPDGTTRSRARRAMAQLGFAPQAGRGVLDSGNCPFVARSLHTPEAACQVALSLATGIAGELDGVRVERVVPGACCVRLLLPGKQAG